MWLNLTDGAAGEPIQSVAKNPEIRYVNQTFVALFTENWSSFETRFQKPEPQFPPNYASQSPQDCRR